MKRYTKFTKLLALVLAMVLMTTCLAGCFGSSDEPTAPPTDPPVVTPEETDPPVETEAPTEAPTEPETVYGTVNTDKLNVRTKANSNSPSIKKLAVNTRLEILEILTVDNVTWGRIAEGWINMKYVTLDSDVPDTPVQETPAETQPPVETEPPKDSSSSSSTGKGTKGTITADSLNVRKGPGTKYDSVGKVKKGDKVEILETDGNWGKISNGWISLKYVKLEGSTSGSSSSSDKDKDSKYSTLVTDGNTKALGKVTVGELALNVRYGPGTDYDRISSVKAGEVLSYYQKKGNWIRVEKGWISYKYVTEGGSSSSNDDKYSTLVTDGSTKVLGQGTITASSLRVRFGPGTEYDQVTSVKNGDKVTYYQKSGNWIRIDKGWIDSKYVKMDSSSSSSTPTYTTGKGTVTASALLIREGAGTNYKEVGKLANGATVEILEVKDNWGRIDKGWICLDYVKMS